MTASRQARRSRSHGAGAGAGAGAASGAVAVVVALLAVFGGAGSASAADDDTNITVQVTAPSTPAPTTTNSSTGSGAGGGLGSGGKSSPSTTTTRSTDTGAVVVTSDTNPPKPGDDEYSLGGVLYVGGLGSTYQPSINPLSGDLEVHFTVRNVSTEVIDAKARFWLTNVFGGEISSIDPVQITGLKPNESTTVDATLGGTGQWTFGSAHVTLTPPDSVAGTDLEPMTRETAVFLPPWFLLILAGLGAVAYAVRRILRYATEPQLVEATA